MMKQLSVLVTFAVILILPPPLLASLEQPSALEDFLASTTRELMASLSSIETKGEGRHPDQALDQQGTHMHFEFYSIKLRLRPHMGFKIQALTTLRLIPEIELSWSKRRRLQL